MIKVAQIGVGYWGPNLLRNLVANKRCKVARVVDLSSERQEYVRGLYPAVNVTDKVEDVLGDPEVEAVVIATPVATHHNLAMRALSLGKHILVEKPMARSVAEAGWNARTSIQPGPAEPTISTSVRISQPARSSRLATKAMHRA